MSQSNLTFRIYFSGLLEMVPLVQRGALKAQCAARTGSSPWGEETCGEGRTPEKCVYGRCYQQVNALFMAQCACEDFTHVCVDNTDQAINMCVYHFV